MALFAPRSSLLSLPLRRIRCNNTRSGGGGSKDGSRATVIPLSILIQSAHASGSPSESATFTTSTASVAAVADTDFHCTGDSGETGKRMGMGQDGGEDGARPWMDWLRTRASHATSAAAHWRAPRTRTRAARIFPRAAPSSVPLPRFDRSDGTIDRSMLAVERERKGG